jgi:hypothetical protein
MRKSVIIISCILSTNVFAQYFDYDVNYSGTPQGYQVESLSGLGVLNNLVSNISNLSNANPASMVDYNKKAQLGLSYQFESDIQIIDEPFFNVKKERGSTFFPHSIGSVFKIKNTRIGLAISQAYNSNKITGPYELTVGTLPSGTDTIQFEDNQNVQIFRGSILLSQMFPELFFKNDGLSIGIKYSYLFLNSKSEIVGNKSKADFGSFGFCLGLRYDYEYSPNYRFSLGFKYEKGSKIKSKKIESNLIFVIGSDTTKYRVTKVGIVPDRIELGAMLSFNDKLSIILNSSYVLWENYPVKDILRYKYEFQNQIELNSSIIYQIYENLRLSMGFYKTDFSYSTTGTNFGSGKSDPYSAIYLTIGGVLKIKDAEIDVAFADSHLLSDELRKQTIFKMGFNYFFNHH